MTFDPRAQARPPKEVRVPDMISEQAATTPEPVLAASQDVPSARLFELQARALDLQLRVSSLAFKSNELREQRDNATGADRARLHKQWADAQQELSATAIKLEATNADLRRLQKAQDWKLSNTTQPPSAPPFPSGEQIMQLSAGGILLMFPLVLALARRLWVRGGRTAAVDIESSPRLQRMEQAIESIAIEVERIGEAQRFATKLLSERQAEAVNRAASVPLPIPRREPGTITPH
jgi:leucyl-tRNA synthetase